MKIPQRSRQNLPKQRIKASRKLLSSIIHTVGPDQNGVAQPPSAVQWHSFHSPQVYEFFFLQNSVLKQTPLNLIKQRIKCEP
jgi:hypothetical protein